MPELYIVNFMDSVTAESIFAMKRLRKNGDYMDHCFKAFGLKIASEIPLALPEEMGEAEVVVRRERIAFQPETEGVRLEVAGVARFLIREGREILVDAGEDVKPELLGVYVLGSCMGAIQYQRGGLLLHGSCVAREGKGILLIGDSGVGKSTMARELITRGWRLVTDDVASIVLKDGCYCVQASYPSQKLWQDAMTMYSLEGRPLWQKEREEKFNVDVTACFQAGLTPLRAVVRLFAGEMCELAPVENIARVDQLMRNLYRPYMIRKDDREKYFQRCVDMADEVPMYLGVRTGEKGGTKQLCNKLEEAFR
ncbi:MAG: hypothetical protein IKB78_03765 [Clostridia bacterium]|nr:hypothetical protein [Clostridia bacterium]